MDQRIKRHLHACFNPQIKMKPPRYWLFKSEPSVFSIDRLAKMKKAPWDGVRNYQARNFMRDEIKLNDLVLFYHSSVQPAGIAGLARVVKESYPDAGAQDKNSDFYDPKASAKRPIWFMVDVEFVKKFSRLVTLSELKSDPAFKGMMVIRKGVRLSIQPVSKEHFERICGLGS